MKALLYCGVAVAALGMGVPVLAQDREPGICYVNSGAEPTSETFVCYEGRVILVSGSRSETLAQEEVTGTFSVIGREQIDQRQARDIADVLRDVPGVAVASVAGQTQLRLRGAEANHVLVLVDGIEVSDPFAGEFDIGTLQAEIGASVEVLRGPQSALYGSDAIGGVVAYQSGEFDGFAARVEGGTNNTINGAARVGTSGSGWNASLSATVVSTNGEPNAREGARVIGRDSYTVSGKGAVDLTDTLTLRATARAIRTEGQFNDQDFDPTSPTFGFVIDSPGTRFTNDAVYALVGARLEAAGGAWTHDLSAQVADITRDTFGAFGPSNASEGDRLKASYVTAYALSDAHTLTFAADWERERFRNATQGGFAFNGRRQIENIGLVGEYRYNGEKFDAHATLRHDFNDRFADETTFSLGAGYHITDTTRLRAAAGSGIKNPGFVELFGFVDGRFIGNENLKPEQSTSWEVGLDQGFGDGFGSLALTYFNAELEDEIFTTFPAPTFTSTPANRTTKSKQQGLEVALNFALDQQWHLAAAYTYLDAEEDGVEEVRRPPHMASASLNWDSPDSVLGANLTVRYNGRTADLAFTDPSFVPVRVTLDDYTLVNFNLRAQLAEGLELFGRVENLLDERHEQVFSFVAPGRQAVAGFNARF